MDEIYTPDTLPGLKPDGPLYGVIGQPISHSKSPPMQLAAFHACGIPARYVRVEISPEALPGGIRKMRELPFAGWNCTVPHKFAMSGLVDELAESARQLGAVNTVLNDNGRLIGFNTDGEGWVRAIRSEFSLDIRDLRILVLGTGGAGHAIASQAALEGCQKLVLVNRTESKARELSLKLAPCFKSEKLMGADSRLKVIPWDEKIITRELNQIDLLVNGSSLGLKPQDPSPLPARALQPHLCVQDLIYLPQQTRLLEAAREAGARGADGLSMLLHQGALAFEIWTGRTAPVNEMKKALLESMSR